MIGTDAFAQLGHDGAVMEFQRVAIQLEQARPAVDVSLPSTRTCSSAIR